MAKNFLTDEEVVLEIERLKQTDEVKLARKKQRLDYKYRQQLYMLRNLYKKGKAMMEMGITSEKLDLIYAEAEAEERREREAERDAALRAKLMAIVEGVSEEDVDG